MKKFVVATLLAVASTASMSYYAVAQQPVDLGSGAQTEIKLAPAEKTDYDNANALTDPKAKATALEAFLIKYPTSQVKLYELQALVAAYSQVPDPAKTVDAADRLLAVDPNNLQAYYFAAAYKKVMADPITDATQKQAALDVAASYAQKGLQATKPKDTTDADFNKMKSAMTPTFYSVIGAVALNKKDTATAIDAYKKELASVPVADTQDPQKQLLDTFFLGEAYLESTPPDLVNCAFYMSRAAAFAPDQPKAEFLKRATYCYKRYHGDLTDFEKVTAAATANLNPPAGFSIKPADTPADIAAKTIADTPDLATLATADKEFILQYGKPEDAKKVFDTIKGKTFKIDNELVIASTPTQLQLAVSEDAVQTKTADYTVNLKPVEQPEEPKAKTPVAMAAYKRKVAEAQKTADAIAAATVVGAKVTVSATYDSYTANPIMITMSGGEVQLPEAAKPAARPAAHRPAAH